MAGVPPDTAVPSAEVVDFAPLAGVAKPAAPGTGLTVLPDGSWWCWDEVATLELVA